MFKDREHLRDEIRTVTLFLIKKALGAQKSCHNSFAHGSNTVEFIFEVTECSRSFNNTIAGTVINVQVALRAPLITNICSTASTSRDCAKN